MYKGYQQNKNRRNWLRTIEYRTSSFFSRRLKIAVLLLLKQAKYRHNINTYLTTEGNTLQNNALLTLQVRKHIK